MKKVFFILLIFTACKRGDEDPSFSLLSRTTRLSSDWQVKTEITQSSIVSLDIVNKVEKNISTSSQTEKFENNSYYFQFIKNDSAFANQIPDSVVKGKVSINRFSIYKDGNFNTERDYSYQIDSIVGNNKYILKKEINIIEVGIWAFLYGNKPDRKSKEEVQFDVRSKKLKIRKSVFLANAISPINTEERVYNYSFIANENSFIWRLIGLKGSKIHAQIARRYEIENTTKIQNNLDSIITTVKKNTITSNTDLYLEE